MKRTALALLIIVTSRALHHLVQRYATPQASDEARADDEDDELPFTD